MLLVTTTAATFLTPQVIIALLGAAGIGGIIKAVVDRYLNKDQHKANIADINITAQAKLSGLINDGIDKMRERIQEQDQKIEELKGLVVRMRQELDESSLARRLQDKENDNIYLKQRVQVLTKQVGQLQEENLELIRANHESEI